MYRIIIINILCNVIVHQVGHLRRDCSNYRGISPLTNTYKILSNILLPRLTLHTEKIIRDHQCGFLHNMSTTAHIFCIHQLLEKKWEYNEAVHQLYIDVKEACDSSRRGSCIIFSLSLVSP